MMVEQNSISAKQWMTKLVTLIFAIFANMKHSPQAKLSQIGLHIITLGKVNNPPNYK